MLESELPLVSSRLNSLEDIHVGLVVDPQLDGDALIESLISCGVPSDNISVCSSPEDCPDFVDVLLLPEPLATQTLVGSRGEKIASSYAIVVISSETNRVAALPLIEAGVQDFLSLPELTTKLLRQSLLHAAERHHLRSHLKQMNRRLEAVIAANADGCLVVQQNGIIVFANPSAAELLGRSGEQLVGSTFGAPLVEHDFAEIELLLPEGQGVTAELRVADIDWEGAPACLVSLRDVTQRRQAQRREQRYQQRIKNLVRQLSESEDRERRRLARVLHDDLQHSLLSAKISLQLVDDEADLEQMRSQAARVTDYLDEAIKTSRTLTSELTPTVLDDKGLVPALQWLAGTYRERYGLRCEIRADEDVEVTDVGLRAFLFQAVRELLLNVVKHAGGANATVSVLRQDEDRVRLQVSDDGPGFDPGMLDSGERNTGGFGLFHLQERIEHFGGTLSVESSPETGTRFSITVGPPAEFDGGDLLARRADSTSKTTVLIIDDQRSFRFLFTKMLEKTGVVEVVGAAGTGQEARELVERLEPDVALCDVSLPDIQGPELVEQLVQIRPALRVIACSMFEPAEMAAKMQEAGAETYLRKDVSVDQFKRAICQIDG